VPLTASAGARGPAPPAIEPHPVLKLGLRARDLGRGAPAKRPLAGRGGEAAAGRGQKKKPEAAPNGGPDKTMCRWGAPRGQNCAKAAKITRSGLAGPEQYWAHGTKTGERACQTSQPTLRYARDGM